MIIKEVLCKDIVTKKINTFMHLADAFIQSDLHCIINIQEHNYGKTIMNNLSFYFTVQKLGVIFYYYYYLISLLRKDALNLK